VAPAAIASAAPGVPDLRGPVLFIFGAETPTIVCAVSQVCDLRLQPGEKVNQLVLGDTDNWRVDQASEGSGATEIVHLIIKPASPDSGTSMVVLTKVRTYHLRLQSDRKDYMLQVAFSYPVAEAKPEEEADESDGLVRIGNVTYVKGREPRSLVNVSRNKPDPVPPGEAVPRPDVKAEAELP
jgi:hypothetical protein